MKIKVQEIPTEGVTLEENFDPVGLELQTQDLKFTAPLAVHATLFKERDALTANVEAAGKLELICTRCLESYHQDYNGRFNLGVTVEGKATLDLTPDIRQEILLSYPVKFLCQESCQGLCPRCGTNLNRNSCSCAT